MRKRKAPEKLGVGGPSVSDSVTHLDIQGLRVRWQKVEDFGCGLVGGLTAVGKKEPMICWDFIDLRWSSGG